MNICLFLAMLSMTANESNVRKEDSLVFFPTAARLSDDGKSWLVPVHGIVFTPSQGGLAHHAVLGVFRRFAGIEKEDADGEIFQTRARAFLADNQGQRDIFIRIGDAVHAAGTSAPNGHFQTTLTLKTADVEAAIKGPPGKDATGMEPPNKESTRKESTAPWLEWEAVLPASETRTFAGRAQLIAARGVSIISDIDDTIKVSNVANRKELLRNTFAKPFEPVSGMATCYARFHEQGAIVHYVSASPWQLYSSLEEFRELQKFPRGSWELRHFRWKDSSATDLLGSKIEYKTEKIETLLFAYPQRKFVCVGDSGEQDPETYGQLARKHPQQIAKIYIRNLSDEEFPSDRAGQAFADIPGDKWKMFRKAEELDGEKIPTTD